jgi:hypothetical protein
VFRTFPFTSRISNASFLLKILPVQEVNGELMRVGVGKFRSTVSEVVEYYIAAIRSDGFEAFSKACKSLVDGSGACWRD